MLTVAWRSGVRVPEAVLGAWAVLKNPEGVAGRLNNSHDAINGDAGNASHVEFLQLGCSAGDGKQVTVGDGHEARVAKDLEPSQLTKVDRLQRLQIDLVLLLRSLLRRRVDALELQRLQRLAIACEQGSPRLGIQVSNSGPRNRKRGEVLAVLQRVEYHTVRFGRVETVEPHALDLGS
jgi:hypothetical protein